MQRAGDLVRLGYNGLLPSQRGAVAVIAAVFVLAVILLVTTKIAQLLS
jgi:hypothetical protein